MKTPDIVYIRWLAWSIAWLVCIAIFASSARDAVLMLAGVFAHALGRFVDYVIVEVSK